jgi:hypothetical protein
MQPCEGKQDEVNEASDEIVSIQNKIEAKLALLNQEFRDGLDPAPSYLKNRSSEHGPHSADIQRVSFDPGFVDPVQTEIRDLKSLLVAATTRERDRVLGLQV